MSKSQIVEESVTDQQQTTSREEQEYSTTGADLRRQN